MLHSARDKMAHFAAAGNNPSSAPTSFPHPPGSTRCPQEMDIQDYPCPALAGTAPPRLKIPAPIPTPSPHKRESTLYAKAAMPGPRPLSSHAGINPPAPGRIRTQSTLSPTTEKSTKGHVADPTPATAHSRTPGDQPQTSL